MFYINANLKHNVNMKEINCKRSIYLKALNLVLHFNLNRELCNNVGAIMQFCNEPY